MSHVDVETAVDGLPGDLHLELGHRLVELDVATTSAPLGQMDGDDLIDLLRGWTIGFRPVILTRLTTARLGILLGRAFGEGSRLTFLGPLGFLEFAKRVGQQTFELGDTNF
jgi:hypothetical protein